MLAEPLVASQEYCAAWSWAKFPFETPPDSRKETETIPCISDFSSVLFGPYVSFADSRFVNPWLELSVRYKYRNSRCSAISDSHSIEETADTWRRFESRSSEITS